MTALAHVDQPPPPPRTLNKQFPLRLQNFLLQVLSKDPKARFRSGEEMQTAYYDAVKAMDEDTRRICYWATQDERK
jgi:serine/threonine protein kinase